MKAVIANMTGWAIGIAVIAAIDIVFMIFWKSRGFPKKTFTIHKFIINVITVIIMFIWTYIKLVR